MPPIYISSVSIKGLPYKCDKLLKRVKMKPKLTQTVKYYISIRQMLGSNLSRGTNNTDCRYMWFYSVPPGKIRDRIPIYTNILFLPVFFNLLLFTIILRDVFGKPF
jgi:hypothetical protein